jgi:zinc transport system substrate-binding protein
MLGGCGKEEEAGATKLDQKNDKLIVYTTIYPLYDFAQKIGGEFIQVHQIIPPGSEAHHFEPSAKLLATLSQADILIFNGADMEPWITKVKGALEKSQLHFVNSSQNVTLLKTIEEQSHENEDHHENHAVDPHIWLSPFNAKLQCQAICDAFVEKDYVHAGYYKENYGQLVEQLNQLDAEYRYALGKCTKKELIVSHNSFGYLARDYGLIQIPIRGLAAEAEPTPGKIKEIIALAKEHDIRYIFYESLIDPKVSRVIAEEAGLKTLELNPLGNLSLKELERGEDYFSVMRANLANLKIALSNAS